MVWVALVDLIVGEPFHTFAVLAGIVTFTVLHYLLHLGYGARSCRASTGSRVNRASHRRGSLRRRRESRCVDHVLLSQMGLGSLAWLRIFGGKLVASRWRSGCCPGATAWPALAKRSNRRKR